MLVGHMGKVVVLALVVSTCMQVVQTKCPFSSLWMEGSPHKLPNDHPYMKAYIGDSVHSEDRRHLLQGQNKYKTDYGYCKYMNRFTQSEDCVQFTGPYWASNQAEAEKWCAQGGPMPGAVGTYGQGSCPQFDAPNFAGVCKSKEGANETATAFVEVEGNLLASCSIITSSCKTFASGIWDSAGGVCGDGQETQAPSQKFPGKLCQLEVGIAGGGHMARNATWGQECPNSNSTYSTPRRWTAEHVTIATQRPSKARGPVWYDLDNNRKRQDVYIEEGDYKRTLWPGRNNTFVHIGGTSYMINWDNNTCVTSSLPVGNLRPNWIIDSEGLGAVSQYLGTQYVQHDGQWKRVKQFRKTEPLEDAYMIQMFDDEGMWDTPEGQKRRPLLRMTPGAPFQGDAIDIYYNHSTDFSDDVFDVIANLDCRERRASDSPFDNDFLNGTNTTSAQIQGSGLNFNSSLHVDSSVIEVRCAECDIEYEDSDNETAPDTIDIQESIVRTNDVAPDADAASFDGQEIVKDDPQLQAAWSFDSSNDTLTITIEGDFDNKWISIGFPENGCQMVPAEAVIATSDGESNVYSLQQRSMGGVQLSSSNAIPFHSLYDSPKRIAPPQKILEVQRVQNAFPLSVIWAIGQTPTIGYHGIDNRGCFQIEQPS